MTTAIRSTHSPLTTRRTAPLVPTIAEDDPIADAIRAYNAALDHCYAVSERLDAMRNDEGDVERTVYLAFLDDHLHPAHEAYEVAEKAMQAAMYSRRLAAVIFEGSLYADADSVTEPGEDVFPVVLRIEVDNLDWEAEGL